MFAFWIAAAVLSAVAAGLMLARGARAVAVGGEDPSLAVHRRQLAEIDELAGRGLLAETERRAARAEAGRRLLAAAETGERADSGGGRRTVLAVAALTPLLAMALYFAVGRPGAADQPYAARLAQWRAADPAKLDPPRMAAVLKAVAAERPDDPEPLRFLALAEIASGNRLGAEDALRRAIAIAPGRADLRLALAEISEDGGEGQVRGMVAGLAARLEAGPDDPDGWARLVRAYGVLGESDKRAAALAKARALFKDRPGALAAIEEAAR